MLVHNTCAVTEKTSSTSNKALTLEQNKQRGAVFESLKLKEFSRIYSNSQTQITIRTASGTRTRVDAIGYDEKNKIVIHEFKSSATARLTKNQEIAFDEIRQSGGIIVGRGKGAFRGEILIPAETHVKVIRP